MLLTFRTRFLVAGVIKEVVSWLWEFWIRCSWACYVVCDAFSIELLANTLFEYEKFLLADGLLTLQQCFLVWKVYREAETHSAGRSHANYNDLEHCRGIYLLWVLHNTVTYSCFSMRRCCYYLFRYYLFRYYLFRCLFLCGYYSRVYLFWNPTNINDGWIR